MLIPTRYRKKLPLLLAIGVTCFLSLVGLVRVSGFHSLRNSDPTSRPNSAVQASFPDLWHKLRHPGTKLPSLFPQYTTEEMALPQHDVNLPFPEGRNAKFIRFENSLWGVGFNNQLTEILLLTYVAYEAGRSYVFTPIQWDLFSSSAYIYEDSDKGHMSGTARVNRIPLRGYLDSPTSGSPYPPLLVAEERGTNGTLITPAGTKPDPAPRAVSDKWYDRMCPRSERLQINGSKVNEQLQFHMKGGVGALAHWIAYLKTLPSRCVSLRWDTDRVVDYGLMASEHILDLWPIISKSPVFTSFRWSPLVLGAVKRNLVTLKGTSSCVKADSCPHSPDGSTTISNLITLHLRRRDFRDHCRWMADWGTFFGWCALRQLPDPFRPGPNRADDMVARCWIEKETILERLRAFRTLYLEEHNIRLRNVYMATNADDEWLAELKEALHADGWENALTLSDLNIEWDERTVDNAIDMEIAARGEVFIGNGFSSLSSTIVMLRMLRELAPFTTRMW